MKEVVKFITDDDHILQVSVAVLSEEAYQKLPDDLKKAVDKAIADTKPRVDARSAGILKEARDISIKENGVQFLGRPTDYDVWAQKARTIWPDFYKDVGENDTELGKQIIDKVFKAASE
jgi:TRAP-type C4-dicarboxylate transport system substrate-binding protein